MDTLALPARRGFSLPLTRRGVPPSVGARLTSIKLSPASRGAFLSLAIDSAYVCSSLERLVGHLTSDRHIAISPASSSGGALKLRENIRVCIAPGSLDTSLSHAAVLSDIAVCHA